MKLENILIKETYSRLSNDSLVQIKSILVGSGIDVKLKKYAQDNHIAVDVLADIVGNIIKDDL